MSNPISHYSLTMPVAQPFSEVNRSISINHQDVCSPCPFPVEAKAYVQNCFKKLLSTEIESDEVKPLLDYIISEYNDYSWIMKRDDLKIHKFVDLQVTESISRKDQNSWLMNIKQELHSMNLKLDVKSIKKQLKNMLETDTYNQFNRNYKQQLKDKTNNEIDSLINTCLLMGENIHRHFATALACCGYGGLVKYRYASAMDHSAPVSSAPRKKVNLP